MLTEKFIGTWELVRYVYRDDDDNLSYPFGENVDGMLIYTRNGFVSVQMVSRDRAQFESEDIFSATDGAIRQAYLSLNTYYGVYEVDEANRIVTHLVDQASVPNRAGARLEREFEFGSNTLTLRAAPRLLQGQWLTGELLWERT